MKKRPSSIDVARRAKVSQATVSYVLSGRTDKAISDDTRARVLQAADELGYTPNRLAEGILRGRTMTIGVLMPDFGHTFNAQLLMGIEEGLAEHGYRILIAYNRNHAEAERQQVRMLMEQRVDGLVAVTDENTVESMGGWVEEVRKAGTPIVVVDDRRLEGTIDTVITDDVNGAYAAIQHLIDLGHRRIAYLGGGERASSARDRFDGYRNALESNGIDYDPELFVGACYWTKEDPDLASVLALSDPPTALFSASDGLLCQSVARYEEEQGRTLPENFALVGYGNLEWARYMGLSSINQRPREMGRRASDRLLRRLGGENAPAMTVRLPVELIIRRSSRPR